MQISLSKLWLQQFRLHQDVVLDLSAPITLISGTNGSGKTSLIEAIALIGTGKSIRAAQIAEMIAFDAELARVKGVVQLDGGTDELEILLTRGEVQGARAPKTKYLLNGVSKRRDSFARAYYPVLFRPEEMRLIEGSPSRRRAFLDSLIGAVDPAYARALRQYEQVLKRRNRLLWQVREREQPRDSLQYWNVQLVEHGRIIQAARAAFVSFTTTITGERSFNHKFTLSYQPKSISTERIESYLDRAIAAGHTLIGPHKDDIMVEMPYTADSTGEPRSLARFGSRGQQRLAVLWLKVCELEYVRQYDRPPVFLLDDSYSELDPQHRAAVSAMIRAHQTVITSADPVTTHSLEETFGLAAVEL